MAKKSRDKGKVGEREFAKFLQDRGYEARRGQQFSGGGDSPDVVHSVPFLHFEVKRVESLRLWPALEQAENDAPAEKLPAVAHRPNRRDWVIVMYADDFFDLLRWTGDKR